MASYCRNHQVEVSTSGRELSCDRCGDQMKPESTPVLGAITEYGRVCKTCKKAILDEKLRVAEGKRRMIEARQASEVKKEALEVLREMRDLKLPED